MTVYGLLLKAVDNLLFFGLFHVDPVSYFDFTNLGISFLVCVNFHCFFLVSVMLINYIIVLISVFQLG